MLATPRTASIFSAAAFRQLDRTKPSALHPSLPNDLIACPGLVRLFDVFASTVDLCRLVSLNRRGAAFLPHVSPLEANFNRAIGDGLL